MSGTSQLLYRIGPNTEVVTPKVLPTTKRKKAALDKVENTLRLSIPNLSLACSKSLPSPIIAGAVLPVPLVLLPVFGFELRISRARPLLRFRPRRAALPYPPVKFSDYRRQRSIRTRNQVPEGEQVCGSRYAWPSQCRRPLRYSQQRKGRILFGNAFTLQVKSETERFFRITRRLGSNSPLRKRRLIFAEIRFQPPAHGQHLTTQPRNF